MDRICVFCGSSVGGSPIYRQSAEKVARAMASRGLGVVYGGGSIGLMGVLADAALAAGAEVVGVIPDRLAKRELMHAGLSHLRIVRSMHERKATMANLASAFLALPGGFGTFDELFEIITWAQLGEHAKPIGVLNVHAYFDSMLEMVRRMIDEKFVKEKYADLFVVDTDIERLLDRFAFHHSRILPKELDTEGSLVP